MTKQPTLTTRRGFTLTEILVTVAIISILGVLILSASSSMIEKAKAAKSMNNLRQIGQGLAVVCADGPPGKGSGPNCYPSYAGIDDAGGRYSWIDLVAVKLDLAERQGTEFVYHGPAHQTIFQSPFRDTLFDPQEQLKTASYGYNYVQFGHWSTPTSRAKDQATGEEIPPTRMASIRNPASIVIAGETDGDGEYDTHLWPPWRLAGMADDYREGGHLLFADWHIEFLNKEEVTANYQDYFVPD